MKRLIAAVAAIPVSELAFLYVFWNSDIEQLLAILSLAVTLPSAPGCFGSLQPTFIFALTPFDIPNETTLAAIIYFSVAQWLAVSLIGSYIFVSAKADFKYE